MYKVSISYLDKTCKAQGKTLLEAFMKLKIDPPKLITGFAELTMQKGDKKIIKLLNTPKLKRFALNDIFKGVLAKMYTQGLK